MKSHVAANAAAVVARSSLLALDNRDRSIWRAPLAPGHMLNSSSFRCHCISSYLLQPLSAIIQPGSTITFHSFSLKIAGGAFERAVKTHLSERGLQARTQPTTFIYNNLSGLIAGLKSHSVSQSFIFLLWIRIYMSFGLM